MSQAGLANTKGGGSGNVQTLTGNTGGAVGPTGNNINVVGATLYTVTGNPGTSTLTVNPLVNAYPITPYVVGPVGAAGYQTIQSAINAANANGGGLVRIQPGTYTENLILFDKIFVEGCGVLSSISDTAGVFIIGTHTPATSGAFSFNFCDLVSATDVFFSNAAGTAQINVSNASITITNGYLLNLPNWSGILGLWNVDSNGTNDGAINNPNGHAPCYIYEVGIGSGTGNTAQISGTFVSEGAAFYCPVTFGSGSVIQCDDYQFQNGPVTFSGNASGLIDCARFTLGANPITMNSSGNITITGSTINSSNNPAITGTGAGTLTLAGVSFTSNTSIANTVTLGTSAGLYPGGNMATVGYVWTSNGADTVPTFQAPAMANTWTDKSTSFAASTANGYFVTGNATATLPASPSQGNTIAFIVDGAVTLTITANTGQVIRIGAAVSASAGTAANNARGDSVTLVYRSSDTAWIASSVIGTWTVT